MAFKYIGLFVLFASSFSAGEPRDEDLAGACALKIPGVKLSKLMLNEPGNLTVTAESNGHRCLLTVVAIGGGGGDLGGSFGGGGSGHIAWERRAIRESTELHTFVGRGTEFWHSGQRFHAEASYVVWPDRNANSGMVYASPGGDAWGNDGGDGYCGGGRKGSNGGTDGSDGEGGDDENREGNPGYGSGLNLTDIVIEGFELTPGLGGFQSGRAGGAGGVLVDGEEPWPCEEAQACRRKPPPRTEGQPTQGEGYGAGGHGYGDSGNQGVILMSIQQVPHPCDDNGDVDC